MGRRIGLWCTTIVFAVLAAGVGASVEADQPAAADQPPGLVPVTGGYVSGRSYLLRREAAAAYEAMREGARRERITLWVVSAYRPFRRQRELYLLQVRLDGPGQTTVARPGFSEHELGTAVDLCGRDASAVVKVRFGDTPAGRWLLAHAPEFGFALSYTAANQAITGISTEPWHYRYHGREAAPQLHRAALRGEKR
jgi:zinc D-Ala-D-Ala carboxypeptidase